MSAVSSSSLKSLNDQIGKVRKEEKELRFWTFDRFDALNLGMLLGKELRGSIRPAAVLIIDPALPELPVFAWSMDGKEESHYGWAVRKIQTVLQTGISSWQAKLLNEADGRYEDVRDSEKSALAAGAFPIRNPDGDLLAIVGISGLKEPDDHPLLVRALGKLYENQKICS